MGYRPRQFEVCLMTNPSVSTPLTGLTDERNTWMNSTRVLLIALYTIIGDIQLSVVSSSILVVYLTRKNA